MGKLAVQKYFSFTILLITVLLMVFTLVGLFGGDVNPAGNTARAMLVYALPILIAGNCHLQRGYVQPRNLRIHCSGYSCRNEEAKG